MIDATKPLRFLLVEDDADHAAAVVNELTRDMSDFIFERVDTEEGFIRALEDHPPDIVVSDYDMPAFDGISALRILRERTEDVPFILVTGSIGDEAAAAAVRLGADDYLMKDRIGRLRGAVRQAVERRTLREEQRHLQAERADSEKRFRALAENLQQACWIRERALSEDGVPSFPLTYVSPSCERIFGISQEEYRSGALTHLVVPDDRPVVEGSLRDLEAGNAVDVEYRIRRPDGATRWIHDRSTPDADPPLTERIVGIADDVTEHRETTEALRVSYIREAKVAEELRKADGLKNEFLSAVSHELRTPVTVILGFAEVLLATDQHLSRPDSRLMVENIERNARKLVQEVEDLLDLDRLTRMVVQPKRVPTNIRQLVAHVLAGLDLDGHRLETDVADITVTVDPVLTARILDNLIRNASRYTPSVSVIRIVVTPTVDGLVLVVADEGPGIPDDLKEDVFLPFRHVDPSRDQGQGIGLNLVRRLAELHGGAAWVEDVASGGARFVATLKADVPEPGAHPGPGGR